MVGLQVKWYDHLDYVDPSEFIPAPLIQGEVVGFVGKGERDVYAIVRVGSSLVTVDIADLKVTGNG